MKNDFPAQELLANGALVESAGLRYQTGFHNEHASEALPGALPRGRNAPQKAPYGLYAEQINNTSFTAPRADNLRSWVYRIYPTTAAQGPWERMAHARLDEAADLPIPSPNRHRWQPWDLAAPGTDFVDGLTRVAQAGGATQKRGMSLFAYAASRSMTERVFSNADGDLMILPHQGRLRLTTELGCLDVGPGEIAMIPRALVFRVELLERDCRGFVCENLGNPLRLPERGVVGANGLANERDFLAPVAAYEDNPSPVESVYKYSGVLWRATLKRSPFDVVAWHGTLAPYKYDLRNFNAVYTVTYDHSDPSVFCALTSPSGAPGIANIDFCVLPPRWLVATDTFRPPFFHRNAMSEIVIALAGTPESRARDYHAGSSHVHNPMVPHGPDPEIFDRASNIELGPHHEDTMMVMFESVLPFSVTSEALAAPNFDRNYAHNWDTTPVLFRR